MKAIIGKLRSYVGKNQVLFSAISPVYNALVVPSIRKKQQKLMSHNAEELLLHLDDAMKRLNMFYWLDCGTLLGAIREGGFISHDLDIDIGVFLKDLNPDIHKELQANGFKLQYEYLMKQNDGGTAGLEYTYEFKGISLDVFFYVIQPNNKMCYHYFICEKNMSMENTINKHGGLLVAQMCLPSSGFKKINFMNNHYNVPLDYHSHLTALYGSNYMQPNPKWKADLNRYVLLEGKFGCFTRF